jgi:hypothetical protein
VILIITNRGDHTADWLILELGRRGADYLRLNTEDFPEHVLLSWRSDGRAVLTVRGRCVDLDVISAVWYRRPLPPDLGTWSTPDRGRWALGEVRATLEGLWRSLDAVWVNHPDDNRRAASKLEQLRRARDLGFVVPTTLVTNDKAELHDFVEESREVGVVCKPLEDGLLELDESNRVFFTSRFELAPDDTLADFGPEPYLFQQHVAKTHDIRVTVIGDRAYATRIHSQATEVGQTDWRQAGTTAQHSRADLPEELLERCINLTRSYNLRFSAIDLAALDAEDAYVFFEINPNGQWAWIEQLTGQPLRSAMADLLLGVGEG